MGLLRLVRSFRTDDIHPHPHPSLDTLTALPQVELEALMESWTAEVDAWNEAQKRSLGNAMPRVELCAFLQGMGTAFNPFGAAQGDRHRRWCPFPEWMSTGGSHGL